VIDHSKQQTCNLDFKMTEMKTLDREKIRINFNSSLLSVCCLIFLLCMGGGHLYSQGTVVDGKCCCPGDPNYPTCKSSCGMYIGGAQQGNYASGSPDAFFHKPVIAGMTTICAGQTTTLNAGSGFFSYLWSTGAITQSIITDTSGTYSVSVTNSRGCSLSGQVTVIVNQQPIINVFPSANPVNQGTIVDFTAQVINGGTTPSLQWYVNNALVNGATNSNYSYVPEDNDEVICSVTTEAGCAASSYPVFMSVTGIPATLTIQNEFVSPGPPVCYNATQTITVGGEGTNFMVQQGGSATMIAGHNIIYLPFTKVFPGAYLHGYIAPGGPYCGMKAGSIITVNLLEEEPSPVIENTFFKVYPNPTTGNFILEQKGVRPYGELKVEIFNLLGNNVLSSKLSGEMKYEFLFGELPVGIYFIHLIACDHGETIKLVKSR